MNTLQNHFTLKRTFKASKEQVFNAFSDAEALKQWWGPVESPIEVVKLDFRPGGIFHYYMKGEHKTYGIFKYREINPYDKIVWVNSFANENAEIIKPPFPGIDFPKEILNHLTLEENNGMTTLTITGEPLNATENEINTFYSFTESMEKGFGGTFSQLELYLNKHIK